MSRQHSKASRQTNRKRRKPPYPGGWSTKNSHTSPSQISRAERRQQALEFRKMGYGLREIAEHLGISVRSVWRDIVREMAAIPAEDAAAVRLMELRRLDDLASSIYPNAAKGDIASIDCFLRISHQRCRILGLYPQPPAFGLSVGTTANDVKPKTIEVVFVLPTKPNASIDATPTPQQPKPDYTRAALPPPRRTPTPFGWMEE
jgi:hypothetical protein